MTPVSEMLHAVIIASQLQEMGRWGGVEERNKMPPPHLGLFKTRSCCRFAGELCFCRMFSSPVLIATFPFLTRCLL